MARILRTLVVLSCWASSTAASKGILDIDHTVGSGGIEPSAGAAPTPPPTPGSQLPPTPPPTPPPTGYPTTAPTPLAVTTAAPGPTTAPTTTPTPGPTPGFYTLAPTELPTPSFQLSTVDPTPVPTPAVPTPVPVPTPPVYDPNDPLVPPRPPTPVATFAPSPPTPPPCLAPDHMVTFDTTGYQMCGNGFELANYTNGTHMMCSPCQRGRSRTHVKHSDKIPVKRCQPCAPDTYAAECGLGMCLPCPMGKYSGRGEVRCADKAVATPATSTTTTTTTTTTTAAPTARDPWRAGLAGNWSDPNHAGCPRYIVRRNATFGAAFGADVTGRATSACSAGTRSAVWGPLPVALLLPAPVNASSAATVLVVDFSSKGGPAGLRGAFNEAGGGTIVWSDGNVWSRLPLRNSTMAPTPAATSTLPMPAAALAPLNASMCTATGQHPQHKAQPEPGVGPDWECVACDTGLLERADGLGCVEHCAAGEATPHATSPQGSTGLQCKLCPAGRESVVVGSHRAHCMPCPMDKPVSNAWRTGCVTTKGCSVGQFYDAARKTCEHCKPGRFQHEAGASDCFVCPRGKWVHAKSAFGDVASRCALCEQGHIAPLPSATSCMRCPVGRYANKIRTLCLPTCEEGNYIHFDAGGPQQVSTAAAALNTSGLCALCPAGRANDHLAPRDPDEYSEAKWGSMDSQCTMCAVGKASDARRIKCVDGCGAGLYVVVPAAGGATGVSACASCPAGKFSAIDNAVSSGASKCTACAANKFQPATSADSCTDCPVGQFAAGTAGVRCTCPAGKYLPVGGTGACTKPTHAPTPAPTPVPVRAPTPSPFAAGGTGKPKQNATAGTTPTATGGALEFGGQLVLKLRLPQAAVAEQGKVGGNTLLDKAKAGTIPLPTERAIAASLATSLGVDKSDVKIKSVVHCSDGATDAADGSGKGCLDGDGDAFTIEFLVILASMAHAKELEQKVGGANKDVFTKALVGNLKTSGVTVSVADLGVSTPVASKVGGTRGDSRGGLSAATWAAITAVLGMVVLVIVARWHRAKTGYTALSREGANVAAAGEDGTYGTGEPAESVSTDTAVVRPEEYQNSDSV